ncbi:hypothetical protein Tco_0836626 [Tanacetum coccineum]
MMKLSFKTLFKCFLFHDPKTYHQGTDISKITRKPSRTGKHGHEKRKSSIEAKDAKPKPEKVNLQSNWSNFGQQKYGYKEKDKNKDKTGRNQAWDRKECKNTSPAVPSDIIGPARDPFNGPGQPKFFTNDENENSNVSNSDEPVLLNTPLSDKVECSDPENEIDETDAFLAMEVSSNFEEGYYDSEGDVIFLENLLSDDTTHNLAPEVISDHEPKQNESIHNTSITFSPRNDPLHHEFAGELLTLPSRIVREHEEYLSLMTVLCEILTSRLQENVHANPSSIIESLPVSIIPVEDSDPIQEEIDIFLVPGNLIPSGVENDDSEDEYNSTFLPEHESPNLDHQDNPSAPRPPPEPPDVKIHFKPDTAMNDEDFNQG